MKKFFAAVRIIDTMLDKNDKHTVRWIAKELEELHLFDGLNLYLSKVKQADAETVRQMLNVQYAKLRRLGTELRKAVN